ncbi:MAG: restriction endonuclease subunit S [Patulibacter sp.]
MTLSHRVELQTIARVQGGGSLKLSSADFVDGGATPAFGAGGQNGRVAVAEFDRSGIVLSANGARCGKCFLTPGPFTSLANTQIILADEARVDQRFLWYQLNDERRWSKSGTAQPFIKPSDVKRHPVWLPPLEEQRRIADVLDRADALRAMRRETLARLDELTQSIFTDMFGDVASVAPLGELLARIDSGKSPVCLDRPATPGELGVLKLGAVSFGKFVSRENKAVRDRSDVRAADEIVAGDILMTRKNTMDLVGASAFVHESRAGLFLPDLVFRLVPREDAPLRRRYLRDALATAEVRGDIRRLAGGSAASMVNISKSKLMTVRVPVPPIRAQDEYVQRVELLHRVRATAQAHLAQLDELFASLQQRAFRGDLFSSGPPAQLEKRAGSTLRT